MLVALLCSLALCATTMAVQDFDVEKMAGKWYVSGFATNANWFVSKKSGMKMMTAMMTPTADGDLNISLASREETGCWNVSHLARKTEDAGRFIYSSEMWRDENDMRIVEVVYDNFTLIHTIKTKASGIQILNNLYTRSPDVSAELQAKFTQYSLTTGVLQENIVFLPSNEECPHA